MKRISKLLSVIINLCLIFSISLHTVPTQAQSGVRPLAYTAGGVLALGAVASIQQQQKRCRETGVGCRNNYSGGNQPRRSLSEIFRDVNNPNRYNQNRYNNSANQNVISGSDIVNGISNFFKHKFSGKSQAETALDNQSMMIMHQMNNATDPQVRQYLQAQYEANFQARVDLARAEVAQRTQQSLQQQRQQAINNLNNSNNINNASWGNDVQSQDRYSIAGTSGTGTPTAMLPINANPAVNRNDYIMINPDINHQGHNMGNGVISTPNQGINAQNGQNSIVPAPVYVNPNANSNQGLVNSQTQPITTPITNDANLQGGVIATPEYVANPSDWIIARTDDTPYSKTPGDPIYDTNKKATEAAMIAGYNKTNFYTKSNAPIYKKGNSYITPDMDNHKGNGAWKEANTPEKLNSKSSRNATLDIYFNKIGD